MDDFFNYNTSRSHFDLELHLRCIVAALRLLSTHGIQPGSGSLSFDLFNQLYNRMSWWEEYQRRQSAALKKNPNETKNYNNEFLIVYARDLISSMPSDRTMATNVATRMVAGLAMLGYAVRPSLTLN